MNPAPIEQLLQITAARPEMFLAAGRGRDASSSFDNHLANAASGTASLGASPTNSKSRQASDSLAQSPPTATSITDPQAHNDQVAHEEAAATDSVNTAEDDTAPTKKPVEESDERKPEESEETAEVAALLAASNAVENQQAGTQESADGAEPLSELQATSSLQEPAEAATSTSQALLATDDDATAKDDAAGDASQNLAEGAAASENAAHESSPAAVADDLAIADPSAAPEQVNRESSSKSRRPKTSGTAGDNALNGNPANEPAAKEEGTAATADAATGPVSAKPTIIDRHESSNRNQKNSTARNDLASRETVAAVERPASAPRTQPSVVAPVVASVQSAEATKPAATSVAPSAGAAAKDGKPGILSSLNRLDRAAAHSSRAAHRAGQSESPSHVDPSRFVSRVARAVQTAHERGGPLHLRLSPPELGAMRMELSVNQGTLTATIETDNQIAKQVLLDNLPALRDRLAEQNIRVERFDVDVRRDPSGQEQQQNYAPQDRQQSSRNPSPGARRPNSRHSAAVPGLNEPAPPRRAISSTTINVVA